MKMLVGIIVIPFVLPFMVLGFIGGIIIGGLGGGYETFKSLVVWILDR